jgi:hypothetical protein
MSSDPSFSTTTLTSSLIAISMTCNTARIRLIQLTHQPVKCQQNPPPTISSLPAFEDSSGGGRAAPPTLRKHAAIKQIFQATSRPP